MLRKEKIITMEREKQEAWELAKQLVQIDSSDPGAYEEEIGLWITDWFKKQIADFGGQLADQIHVSRLEVLPGRYNAMAKIPGTLVAILSSVITQPFWSVMSRPVK